MATDGPTPTPCRDNIYRDGEVLFITHSIPSNSMETWVQSVAQDSGQPVDWHFVGGRAVIKALGDLDKVRDSMRKLMSDHDKRYKTAWKKLLDDMEIDQFPRPVWWHVS